MVRTNDLRLGVKAVYLIFILKLLCGAELEQPHEAEPLKVLHHRENETPAGRGVAGTRSLSGGWMGVRDGTHCFSPLLPVGP